MRWLLPCMCDRTINDPLVYCLRPKISEKVLLKDYKTQICCCILYCKNVQCVPGLNGLRVQHGTRDESKHCNRATHGFAHIRRMRGVHLRYISDCAQGDIGYNI